MSALAARLRGIAENVRQGNPRRDTAAEVCDAAADALERAEAEREMFDEYRATQGSAMAVLHVQRDTARADFQAAELARAKAEADTQKVSTDRDDVASWARRCAEKVTKLRAERDAAEALAKSEGRRADAELARGDRLETVASAARPLATFGLAVLAEMREDFGDLEGGWLQEKAVEVGVLVGVEVTEPCVCEHCRCAEYGFPCTCYRSSPAVNEYAALVAAVEGTP